MWQETVPCSWAGVTETAFAQLILVAAYRMVQNVDTRFIFAMTSAGEHRF